MSQPSHLRPVTHTTDGGSASSSRGPQRQRAAKALPTDRMKMDRQVAVLRAFGRLSGPRKEAVDGSALSQAVGGIAPVTVILSNKFFADAGWIVSSGRGLYAATDALVEYTRRLATGTTDYANEVLREPVRQSWFWEALEPHLSHGRLAVNEAIILLMRSADATQDHKPMIFNVIAWLEHVGLITIRDDFILAESRDAGQGAVPQVNLADPQQPEGSGGAAEHGGENEASAHQDSLPRSTLISFSMDLDLTVADLALLSPEQIKAFFEAVGTLAAVKRPT